MHPILDIGGLRLGYRTERGLAQVLDGIDLAVAQGEIVGLVGESGSGKTTLARAVLGMLPKHQAVIESGHVRLAGIDILAGGEAASRARGQLVALVPQDPLASLNPLFNIGTQIRDIMRATAPGFPQGRSGGRREQEAAAVAMLDAVQLSDAKSILRQFPHQLSGGQRQRVMIALALLPEPKIIIADEATAALDVSVQAQILLLFRRVVAEKGISVLFATHDLGVTWEICDRVAVVFAGQLVELARRHSFFSRPRHPYTRQILAGLRGNGRKAGVDPAVLPSLNSSLPACRFKPRCARASALCGDVKPSLVADEEGHFFACHHPVAFATAA